MRADYSTACAALDAFPAGAHNEPVTGFEPGAAGARVLIVGDNRDVMTAFSRKLRLEGVEVWAAASLLEGLRLARLHQPDAVIVDVRMPLASGLQVVRDIRGVPALARTPIAIVTGESDADHEGGRQEAEAIGAELRYKPIWLGELVSLAQELLSVPVPD